MIASAKLTEARMLAPSIIQNPRQIIPKYFSTSRNAQEDLRKRNINETVGKGDVTFSSETLENLLNCSANHIMHSTSLYGSKNEHPSFQQVAIASEVTTVNSTSTWKVKPVEDLYLRENWQNKRDDDHIIPGNKINSDSELTDEIADIAMQEQSCNQMVTTPQNQRKRLLEVGEKYVQSFFGQFQI